MHLFRNMEDVENSDVIEFLDEDAEIVQQCMQEVATMETQFYEENVIQSTGAFLNASLLVERTLPKITSPVSASRKKRKEEYDSDYDPSEDMPIRTRRRKQTSRNYVVSSKLVTPKPVGRPPKYDVHLPSSNLQKLSIQHRRKLDIAIPDYEDPICLPVKCVELDENDLRRLKNWNNLCLNQFKMQNQNGLHPKTGQAIRSVRTLVLRNIKNKYTGKMETRVWYKTEVENSQDNGKSEEVQSTLPNFREKKILQYKFIEARKKKVIRNVDEVILTKEKDNQGEEKLVIYKPKEALSAVYKYVNTESETQDSKAEESMHNIGDEKDSSDSKRYLKETTCLKVCAPCFQSSWRGNKTNNIENLFCPICLCTSASVRCLLTHLKTHSAADICKYNTKIINMLSEVVDYNYRCRLCGQQFMRIKMMRKHIVEHHTGICTESFLCEIGNHMAK